MRIKRVTVGVAVGVLAVAVGVHAAQREWVASLKAPPGPTKRSALTISPRAEVGDRANGVYCVPAIQSGVMVHDLGWLPSGLNLTVTVEGLTEGFDPAAALIVANIGEQAGNAIKTTTYYDNDSGGDKDPKIALSTTQAGNYLLLVNDYPAKIAGCYRYEVFVR